MRILLQGDHSRYHCGSAAAFNAIRSEAARHGKIVKKGQEYDLLVVNGEGTMHHESSGFRKKMAEIESALASDKRVMLVNSVWQDNPQRYADILRRCERVVVREVLSQRALAEQGVSAEVAIDQSFHDEIDESAPYTDLGGQVVFTDFFSKEFECFVILNSKWAQKFEYIDMAALSWSSLVRSLRTASVLVTGRHHAVYAACRARTPFLAMRGNTHKNEGLVATASISIPIFECLSTVREILDNESYKIYDFMKLFDWMEQQQPWTLGSNISRDNYSAPVINSNSGY